VTVCDRGEGGVKFGQEKCDIFFEWPVSCTNTLLTYGECRPPIHTSLRFQ